MKLIKLFSIFLLALIFAPNITASASIFDQVRELLRNRIELRAIHADISVGTERLYSQKVLPEFYTERIYRPVWISDQGLEPGVFELLESIRESYIEGLNPYDYHLAQIEMHIDTVMLRKHKGGHLEPGQLVDLELLLTDAFLILGSHYAGGKVDPGTLDPKWHAIRSEVDMKVILQEAIGNNSVRETLRKLLPEYKEYDYLREALARYRDVFESGGWPVVPEGPSLRMGMSENRIPLLRTRLILAGDLEDNDVLVDDRFFDGELEYALRKFQKRHGLDPDGVAGPRTFAELNVPVRDRLKQVKLNLERWRWLPQDLGNRYIVVNIANFHVDVIEDGQNVLNMRAVVGRHYRSTPVFSGRMTYLVFSPFWHIPPGIAAKDIIPQARKDFSILRERGIRILSGWGADTHEIYPGSIDWGQISESNFPYRFRQDPGPQNALGRVKFMFPNRFNVYIHDTPDRELFDKTVRDFSSGCIRIDKPVELAEYLLRDQTGWNRDTITGAMSRKTERTVSLSRPINVHILYWTAWTKEDGIIHFRKDIYNRDSKIIQVLKQSYSG